MTTIKINRSLPVFTAVMGTLVAAIRPGVAQTPVPPPTPSSAPISLDRRDTFNYSGAADLRYRDVSRDATTGSYLSATRLNVDWTRRDSLGGGAVRGGARVQFYLEADEPGGTATTRLRASEVYGFYNFALPGVSAMLKVGQFVLPFGLVEFYDPLQPIQPLYEKALGLRVDTGIGLEGNYALYRYSVAITTGSGPNRSDFDQDKVISFRLSRRVDTTVGRFEVGGSLLTGRGPVTTFATQLPPSGTSGARNFVDKTRFAGDGQYFFGAVTIRGEVIFGGDGDDAVWGYFAEGNLRVAPRWTAVAVRRLWNFPTKPMSAATTGIGLNVDIGRGVTIRTLYEYQRDQPLPAGTSPQTTKRFTVQTRLNF